MGKKEEPPPLSRPAHIARALDLADGLDECELQTAIRVTDRKAPNYLPEAVLVRLVRRCRSEGDSGLEHRILRALLERTRRRVRAQYRGLAPADRDDMAQEVAARLVHEIAERSGIDYWEITFEWNLARLAADVYQQQKRTRDRERSPEPGEVESRSDGGAEAEVIERTALLRALAHRVLTKEEYELALLMFEGLPLHSEKAVTDIARLTGKPEGTLREQKARILQKLQAAQKEQEP